MQRYFSPSPTYYPCSIPSSHHTGSLRGHPGFGLDAGGNTPILHKDRETDSRGLKRQTNRKVEWGGREKEKKRYEERPATTPTPSFTPPSACRWNDGNKEGGENRETNRGQRRKNERTGVGAYKTNPRPARDWHLVTMTSSSRPPSHSTDTQMNQPWRRLHRALSSLHRVTFHQRSP